MDCNQIRKVAANALITCNIHSFPIDCFAILKQYGFRVYSYLELQKKKPELYNLCISYSQDAFCINSLNLIAYNSQKSANRIRFSLMHELGHHLLRHRNDLPSNEDEANYFASNILAPRIAMYYAHLKSVNEVGQFFNLSSSAAYYALHRIFQNGVRMSAGMGCTPMIKIYTSIFIILTIKDLSIPSAPVHSAAHVFITALILKRTAPVRVNCRTNRFAKKTHAFTPLSDDDSRILRRLENKWLYDF